LAPSAQAITNVDLFDDEEGLVWTGVHLGSRGLGHKTATTFHKARRRGQRQGFLGAHPPS
jgi:RNA-splicing ligase RtcB